MADNQEADQMEVPQEQAITIASINSLPRIPPFWKPNPTLWFQQLEAVLNASNIPTQGKQRFQLVVANLDFDILQQVQEQLADQSYTKLKKRLIEIYTESEFKRVQKFLEPRQLGDETPSALLRQLKALSNDLYPESLIRNLWIRSLPAHIQAGVVTSQSQDLDKLAQLADSLAELGKSNSTIDQIDPLLEIRTELSALKKDLTELHNKKPSPQYFHKDKANYSPRKYSGTTDGNQKHNELTQGICFYHLKFGKKARKCSKGCKFAENE